ncbi:TRAP transporter permease [Candidatus Aalborgicola defluviihabitans]|uniref:TRAP transporter permease n=1 Tax=Candidatus Aalborgicola defluviihabitans TaxID=3386187 RepID=UPI001D76BE7D|nr:TRAP transporter permease [Burkholderiales bacterium]MBK6569015.1 TRAP transporter permease [Burkholderiales bacterium]MBK7313825.1 TRAP transporter permease [Burkholderiales bacterium]
MTAATSSPSGVDLQQLVQEADIGGRKPMGFVRTLMFAVCIGWSVLQLWYASPLPFALRIFVLNDTEMRALHLALALFLAFLAYPFGKHSSRTKIPLLDWVFAALGCFCAAYLFIFYRELSTRPGQPTVVDMFVAVAGVVLLIEATRRVVGPAMAIIAALMLIFAFAGPYMPDAVAHKGVSLSKAVSHYWMSTEGVFGVALGVSSSYIFLFVLFGGLLEKAGAGSYFIKVAYALLGHLRGGPAKAAVVSSGLMGMISGSSVANVVTCGTFTIPLMKRVGYPAHKAGAIETAAGVDGQIMPPVMGAAAFLMAEYVGVPYAEICKNAALPAAISYIALFYIAHLEALKMGLHGLPRAKGSTSMGRLTGFGLTVCSVILLSNAVFYGLGWLKGLMGSNAIWVIVPAIFTAYVAIIWQVSKEPDLTIDDPEAAMLALPPVKETILAGLHYLLPVVLLIWSLLVEELSPGLSAFYASVSLIVILLTQKPLLAFFRGQANPLMRIRDGWGDLIEGLELGARNMIGIGIATACAGIIVGTVSVTGLGLVMTDLVEVVSAGSLIGMLVLVAVVCLILGMGMPTTASYIIVSTLMAPVIVELGSQTGLVVPLVAAHMFVFYFGLMADVTPPVGLASFAAAAIAKADPIKTGVTAFFYSIRTGILPFMFIFNTDLLLIGITSWWHLLLTVGTAIVAMLVFAAATQGWFVRRSRWYESAVLLVVTFTLLRPGFWLDMVMPKYRVEAGTQLVQLAGDGVAGKGLRVRIEGTTLEGKSVKKTVLLPLSSEGDGTQRIKKAGLTVMTTPEGPEVMAVGLKSGADKAGFEQGFKVTGVEVPADRPAKEWMYLPALLLLAAVSLAQRLRRPIAPIRAGTAAT